MKISSPLPPKAAQRVLAPPPTPAASAFAQPDATSLGLSRLSAPVSPVSASIVTASPSPSPGHVGLWSALERAGVLGGSSATNSPVGAALTGETRQALLEMLQRLERNGVRFETQTPGARPGTHDSLSAEAFAGLLEGDTSVFQGLYTVSLDEHQHIRMLTIDDLRLLDAYKGAGPEAFPQRAAAVAAVQSLEARGFDFQTYPVKEVVGGSYPGKGGYACLLGVVRGDSTYLVDASGVRRVGSVSSDEGLLAHDFFHGSGIDRGLRDGALAVRVREADTTGAGFSEGESDLRLLELTEAWKALADGGSLLYGPKTGVKVSVTGADLADRATLEARLAQATDIATRYAAPALANTLAADQQQGFVSAVLDRGASHGTDAIAALLSELVRAERETVALDPVTNAIADLDSVLALEHDSAQLASLVVLFRAALAETGHRGKALEAIRAARSELETRAGSTSEQARLRALLVRLVETTRSLSTALEALDLVRIAVGQESEETRLKLFLDLAAAAPRPVSAHSTRHYRECLVQRLPTETLVETGQRLLSVLHLLTLTGQHDRAVEVFAFVQQGLREGRFGTLSADDVMRGLSEKVLLTRSIDDALTALAAPQASHLPHDGQVQNGTDAVIIGGVKIAKKPRA